MSKRQMMVTKPMKYKDRRMEAGDVFECSYNESRVYEALRTAEPRKLQSSALAPPPAEIAAKIKAAAPAPAPGADAGAPGEGQPGAAVGAATAPAAPGALGGASGVGAVTTAETQPSPDLTAKRAEYERVVGKKAYYQWDAAELQKRIEAHQAPAS